MESLCSPRETLPTINKSPSEEPQETGQLIHFMIRNRSDSAQRGNKNGQILLKQISILTTTFAILRGASVPTVLVWGASSL